MRTTLAFPTAISALIAIATLGGCKPKETGTIMEPFGAKQYDRPLPPGQLALRKLTDPRDIPDFTQACQNLTALRLALDGSLRYLAKASSRAYFPYGEITHEHAVASLKAFGALLETNPSPAQMNAAIREKFDVYTSVGWDGSGTVLFTSYYTPIFEASPTRSEKFRCPLYKQPENLVKGPDGKILGLRQGDGQVVKCPDQKTIDSTGVFAGKELFWLADRFQVHIAQVQGSAKLRMADGRMIDVGYAANNGHDYVSVGLALVADKKIAKGKLSLQAMMDYFKAHPNEVESYVWRNPRFVFFTETVGGPYGCLNEPVVPYRTVATDKEVYPRACLAYVSATLPQRLSGGIEDLPYRGFALDQDSGGAIRAPGRCDFYVGVGEPAAELAGRTYTEGRLYYLFLKPALMTPSALPAMTQPAPLKPPIQP